MSGHKNGVQSKLKKIAPNSVFIHCSAHCLNLALVDAVTDSPSDRQFFAIIRTVKNFLQASCKRTIYLEQAIKKKNQDTKVFKLKAACQTRWSSNVDAVVTCFILYQEVVEALNDITKGKKIIWSYVLQWVF
jgi:hypothetical protein